MEARRTSIEGSDEAPVARVHDARVVGPAATPLDTEALAGWALGPEAKVERGDEEDPVERGPRARVVARVVIRRDDVQGLGAPGAWRVRGALDVALDLCTVSCVSKSRNSRHTSCAAASIPTGFKRAMLYFFTYPLADCECQRRKTYVVHVFSTFHDRIRGRRVVFYDENNILFVELCVRELRQSNHRPIFLQTRELRKCPGSRAQRSEVRRGTTPKRWEQHP